MPIPGTPSRILLIDDLSLARRMIPSRLGPPGRDVDGVANVEEARAYLARCRPHLILLDVVMPGMDGFTFCRELKADPDTCDIPVLILTDLPENAHDRSLEAGADDYLPKRIDDAVLRVRVQFHMNLANLRRKDQRRSSPAKEASILLATSSTLLGAQLPAQFAQDGHRVRVVEDAARIQESLREEDRLLILDFALGLPGLQETLTSLRNAPTFSRLPVLLLCQKEELSQVGSIEFLVDDILWKPLKASVNRHRVGLLLELARRTFQDTVLAP